MKKLSRILCKLLGCSFAINFNFVEISNVKIIAIYGDETDETDETSVNKPNKSDNKNSYYKSQVRAQANSCLLSTLLYEEKPMFPGTNKPMFPNEPSGLNFNQRLEYRSNELVKYKIKEILIEARKYFDFVIVHKYYINKSIKDTFKAKVEELVTMLTLQNLISNDNISLVKKLGNELHSIRDKMVKEVYYKRTIDKLCFDSMSFLKNYRNLFNEDSITKIEKEYIDRAIGLICNFKGEEAKELMEKCDNKMKETLKKYLLYKLKFEFPQGVIISKHDKKVLNKYIDEITEATYRNNIKKLEMLKKGLNYKCDEVKRKSFGLSSELSTKTGII